MSSGSARKIIFEDDLSYLPGATERGFKTSAHRTWDGYLNVLRSMLEGSRAEQICEVAIPKTNLLDPKFPVTLDAHLGTLWEGGSRCPCWYQQSSLSPCVSCLCVWCVVLNSTSPVTPTPATHHVARYDESTPDR